MTLMAQGNLVDAQSSSEMRTLFAEALKGIGTYIKDALDGDSRPFQRVEAKKGFGDDSSAFPKVEPPQ